MNLTLPDVVTLTVNVYGPGRLKNWSCGLTAENTGTDDAMYHRARFPSRGKDCFEKESEK
jgi:hypothetical protein